MRAPRDGGGEGERPVVLIVAFPYAAIGPKAVGGAEVICTQMEAALPALGFGSVVVAHAASEPAGTLYPTEVPAGIITDEVRAQVETAQQANIDRALAEHPVAVVHMHGLDFARYRLPEGLPVVVTLHLPPSWYPETIWSLPAAYQLVCVSESQRRACPAEAQSRLVVIENGVELVAEKVRRHEGRYALMLARICEEKNLHTGLDAARMAEMPAVLGGEVYPYESHLRYFAEAIEPRLTATAGEHESRAEGGRGEASARFVGPVTGAEKRRLLQRAACLLLPSLATETSSLVAMEALAAGTPVIGMAVGAVTEIVEDGRTGFLVQPGAEAVRSMAAALGRLPEIDREFCRATAAARFPVSRMIERYGALYRRLARSPLERYGAATIKSRAVEESASARGWRAEDLTVEELTTASVPEALVAEWTELFAEDVQASAFQHPAWLVPWWRQFGEDGALCALVLREERTGKLAGLLPLYTYPDPATGERKLLLMGAGTTDYLDGVWGANADGAADRALTHIAEGRGWDRVSLHQLRAGSRLRVAAERASLPLVKTEPCSSIDTRVELPARIRANTGRYRRRAATLGEVECRLAESAAEALASFETLVSLHSRRWEGVGERGVLSDDRVLAHHRESLPLLLRAGLLRLFDLRLGGETMGVLYALADPPQAAERRLLLYLVGFEPQFAECSPGTLLVQEAWEHACANGFAKVDLLRGGESYKRLWGARVEETFGIELGPTTQAGGG